MYITPVAALMIVIGAIGLYLYLNDARHNRATLKALSQQMTSMGATLKQLQDAQSARLPYTAVEGVDNLNAQLNRAQWQLKSALQQYEMMARELEASTHFIERAQDTARKVRAGEHADPVANWPKRVSDVAVSHDTPGASSMLGGG